MTNSKDGQPKKIEWNGLTYEVTETDMTYEFKETSDRQFKVHFSFSKDKERNKIAEEGLRIFWSSVL